ncbi:MAG TPA: sulfotransferase [Xanthomonadaceae bacterium]|nr:sulfotransferase [Xanthomonadaceae bacterium]
MSTQNTRLNFPGQTPPANRPLLQSAQAAIERGDLQRAEALFVEDFAQARDDAIGLGNFGSFCLSTSRHANARYLLQKAIALKAGDSDLLSHLGYAQLALKDVDAATRSFEAALAIAPAHASANYGLGLCCQQTGQWLTAVEAFGKTLAAQPQMLSKAELPILLNLAEACHKAGDSEAARQHFSKAEQIAPDDPTMLLAYGMFLREQGSVAHAMQLIDRCGRQAPADPKARLEKARCLRALGDPTQAMRWLEQLEKMSPGLPENSEEYGNCQQGAAGTEVREMHWVRSAGLWIKAGEFGHAEAILDRLLTANPASAAGWNARGKLDSARHRLDEAEAAYHKAIACDPAYLDARANLAYLYENSNRVAQAKAAAEGALRCARSGDGPGVAIELHLALCKVARRQERYAEGLEHLARIDTLAPTESQRMYAAFERGKLMDLCNDASGAMAAFSLGNELAMATWRRANPGNNKYLADIELVLELAGKGWLRQWKPIESLPPTANLAFLVGFPRSGTTLLNQVLDCHDAIQTMEEKPPTQKVQAAIRSIPDGYPHAIARLDAHDIAFLRAEYFRSAAEHGAPYPSERVGSKLIFDKFPLHINVSGMLHRVFPQARFVFALRHPCDVVLSCFMQQFRLNSAMANFLTLADSVALYTRTMDLWEIYRTQLPLNVHTIRYEDVVDDFDGQVRSLCDFLQVPWKDELKQFATRALDRGRIDTPSYSQVSKPIYREARYRWERYREHLAPFLPALRPYIERFGYADSMRGG